MQHAGSSPSCELDTHSTNDNDNHSILPSDDNDNASNNDNHSQWGGHGPFLVLGALPS